MMNPVYSLPSYQIIGGNYQKLIFDLVTEDGGFFDATGCRGEFSMVGYSNKTGAPVVVKSVSFTTGERGVLNVAEVELESADTMKLFGRYIYQISIAGPDGKPIIPGQGLLDVSRNIHPGFGS